MDTAASSSSAGQVAPGRPGRQRRGMTGPRTGETRRGEGGGGHGVGGRGGGERSRGNGAPGGEGETRDQHTPHNPVTTANDTPPPAPLPTTTTTHATPATHLSASPHLSSGEDARVLFTARAQPEYPRHHRARAGKGEGRARTPPPTRLGSRHRTLLTTTPGDSPSHPRQRPPERGGEEEHTHALSPLSLPPRARVRQGTASRPKPGLSR